MMATANARDALFDPAVVRRGLQILLNEGQVTELRALGAVGANDRFPQTISGYFNDAEKLIAALGTIRHAKGVYIVLNEVHPSLLARAANRARIAPKGESTQDTHITRRRWLPIDSDVQRPSGISASDAEHEAAIQRAADVQAFLRSRGWPEPVVIDSGNGGHMLYRVSLAADDGGLVQGCLQALAERFDDEAVKIDTTVFNASRIWKLPGTLACKGDSTEDRPHRLARILSVPDKIECVSVELMHALSAEVPAPEPKPQATYNGNGHSPQPFDVAAFIARNSLDVDGPDDFNGKQGLGKKWVFRTSPMCDHHDGAAFIIQHASGAYTAGCHHNSCSWTGTELRAKYEPRTHHNGNERHHRDDSKWFVEDNANGASGTRDTPPTAAEAPAFAPVTYERITCAELDAAEYEIEYLIRDVLIAGQPMIVAGAKKNLKTSIMVDMAIALAQGGAFLGKFRASRAARVAMMSGESGLANLQETARRVCDAAGYRLADIGGLIWSTTLPQFASERHLEALGAFLTADEIEVVMIDPAYLTMPGGDAGNLFIQGEMLRRVNELCQRLGATLILAHHTKRGGIADPFAPPELEHIAWAGFQEYARQWLLLGRREKYQPGTGSHRMWLSLGGSAGHGGLWAVDVDEGVRSESQSRFWDVSVRPPDEERDAITKKQEETKQTKNAERLEADKRTLANTMAKFPEGETKNVLKSIAGMSGARVDVAMAALLDDGAAVMVEITKGGRKTPREGYRLKDATDAV